MIIYFQKVLKVFFKKKIQIVLSIICANLLFVFVHQFTFPTKTKFATTFEINDIYMQVKETETLLKHFYTNIINYHKHNNQDYFNIYIRLGENIFADYQIQENHVSNDISFEDSIRQNRVITVHYESINKISNNEFLKTFYREFEKQFESTTTYKIRDIEFIKDRDTNILINLGLHLESAYNKQLNKLVVKMAKDYALRVFIVNEGYKKFGYEFLIRKMSDEYFKTRIMSYKYLLLFHLLISVNIFFIIVFYYLSKQKK